LDPFYVSGLVAVLIGIESSQVSPRLMC